MEIKNVTLKCSRIAVRCPDNAWGWFGPAVHFKLKGWLEHPLQWYTANAVLESMCESAVKEYGFDNCKIIEASSEETYELVDLGEL